MSANEKASPRQWLGLSVLLLPTMLLFLAMTVLFLATPYITADLKPSGPQVLWINDIYGFIMAGFLVTMGTLGDKFGRRRILLSGAALFGAASILSAYAPNPDVLIVGRALMGLGAAALVPATLALITNTFTNARQRSVAIGLWAASVSAGVAIGPLVGGLLLESLWWGASLLIGVPVMALVLVTVPLLIPEYKAPNAGRLDPLSVVLSLAALLPFVYGVKALAETGLDAITAVTLVAGIGLGAVFVRRQLRLPEPLIDMRLFRNRTFGGALAVYMFATVALGGVYLLFTQYLQLVADQSPLAAGLWILPAAIALVVVSIVAPILARRVRPAYLIAAGLLASAIGYVVLTQVDSTAGLPLLITGFYILYPGIAPAMALIPDLVISSAPPEKAGAASAVEGTISDLGVALGVAILGSVGTTAYRSHMDTVEVPGEAAAESAETLPGALDAAQKLPDEVGGTLVDAAKTAFTEGLNLAALVAAVLTVIGAVVAVTVLRRGEPAEAADETETDPDTELAEVA
ncbi:MFS transporter [Stackebrandtia nassauensis]|uniref:Major facilitator superfamily MFS_1 n=1 Tax=Stackebrandtia nassauensis (strain DSM 44728 / CIP 108903 / NRRL B-16338 / NBRC 102104 / LLR-40K-21) TaxID=446470 RepID=D3PU07_STANL|nr:MFS transporter [Stackebrandtia nassauensis]ADD40953.1 major facilitator superfamily MFS_1 [Stackebrandtia nassauensis DSM 44728]